ncbi:YfgM family protein [Zhongshania aquimaris]|uniref:Tetratricopeptide repeat protein n=1 Tax=Zhongshania aquimaris TaxID=2857107 RepID=A0ABS6VWA4_9GAMM|nr:tetratricopeptide repeat protein [Zhongshania aquimaris]
METYRTEEEQIEAIKRWWQDNGKSTVFGIALALAIVFGWRGWQGHQEAQAGEASAIFDNLLIADAAVQRDGSSLSTAQHLADTLKDRFASLSYGQFAALFKAKYAVKSDDYAAATAELEWVLKQGPSAQIKAQTEIRLAQVLYSQKEYGKATAYLSGLASTGYAAEAAELEGDVAFAQGDKAAALAAYQRARSLARTQEAPVNNAMLEMKINDLSAAKIAVEGAK